VLPQMSSGMAAGASSFGMSGVNAHGLFTAPAALTHVTKVAAWQGVRHWMLPAPHHLLNAAAFARIDGICRCHSVSIVTCAECCCLGQYVLALPALHALYSGARSWLEEPSSRGAAHAHCRFALQLATERLAYLMDHVVAGRSILPGAAMFEAAAAAGRTLSLLSDSTPLATDLCLISVTIPAPVVLAAGVPQALEVAVDCRSDAVHLARLPNAISSGEDSLFPQASSAHDLPRERAAGQVLEVATINAVPAQAARPA
jgi:hypothetical protein